MPESPRAFATLSYTSVGNTAEVDATLESLLTRAKTVRSVQEWLADIA